MRPGITVLAVGNPIMADDGIGPALLGGLKQSLPGHLTGAGSPVEFMDGGISGMELLPVVEDARWLLVLDAVAGEQPGEVMHLSGDQLPRMLSTKLSPHQVGLLDVFTSARLLGREPEQIEVVGIVPAQVDLRVGLSPEVAAALPGAAALAGEVLGRWLQIPAGIRA
ncbi:hydrogenase maturation protease [Propionibacterium sp.]|uniref:hydrogenase maturation protease n=1 Tax=Propionibacterium sp. TaxID=1977903 RepID=UPI0039ED245C